ncbi:CLUMA_CG014785, isoform A [Clunio marinus]|uniref:CLUMA_CG014785, isoform A n=1 Tax=Clunio marinus TaxID=568069 RepID=A0A1J1IR74_9DIPT|nr:CLUMA_CG014785, isoform A [Clunio marinus]
MSRDVTRENIITGTIAEAMTWKRNKLFNGWLFDECMLGCKTELHYMNIIHVHRFANRKMIHSQVSIKFLRNERRVS